MCIPLAGTIVDDFARLLCVYLPPISEECDADGKSIWKTLNIPAVWMC